MLATWGNPILIILSIYLLFTPAKLFIILFNLNGIIIMFIGFITTPYMCEYVINMVYIGYALMIPLLIFSIFFKHTHLKEHKVGMLMLYLLSFDEITTIAVIFNFFASDNHWIYGILQLVFVL